MRTKLFLVAFLLLLTAFASGTLAQIPDQPYRISDREVAKLLDKIKKESNSFRNSLKDALNKSAIDHTNRENDINAYVKDFEEQTKRLEDNFDSHKSTVADVDAVLTRAARIDAFVSRYPLTSRAQDDWSVLRADLNQLAVTYNVTWRWGGELGPVASNLPYRITDKEVEELIRRIESQSDTFRHSLDSALDRSRLNNTRREDDINAFVKEFYKETKQLHDNFDSHRSTANDVRTVLDRASQIDQFMRRNRLRNDRDAQRDWARLRAHLEELAQVYNVSWRW
jgi:DNA repair exonuclease SbcCD ATPase subunit